MIPVFRKLFSGTKIRAVSVIFEQGSGEGRKNAERANI